MRVLHVSQPSEAGVAAVVAALAANQLSRGWATSVACDVEGELGRRLQAAGVPVHHWRAGRSPGLETTRETAALNRLIRSVDPHVLHLHSSKAGLAGRLAVRGRIPTIYQPHAWSFDAVSGPLRALSREWERLGARWTQKLVCVSDGELASGRAAGVRTPAVVVPNGVDLTRWTDGDRAVERERLGLDPGRPLAVCVGRVCEQKGQDLLLGVWPGVVAKLPEAQLVLVGDGPWAAALRVASAGFRSVSWRGASDPAPWYRAADVVVVPSRWEGMALVPLEAMATGRSVVAHAVGGVAQSLGKTGAVVGVGDAEALEAAIVARLADPDVAALEGRAARARAASHFDLARACERTAEITLSLGQGRPRG